MINLRNLHTDRSSRYSTGRAPRKAVLIIACIKLFENGRLDLRNIRFDDPNILETYRDLWGVLNYDKHGPIQNPLFHLAHVVSITLVPKQKRLSAPEIDKNEHEKLNGLFDRLITYVKSGEDNGALYNKLSNREYL